MIMTAARPELTGGQLPLWRRQVFATHDLDAVRAHMSGVFVPHWVRKTSQTPVAFVHNQAVLRNITLNAMDYGLRQGDVTISVPEVVDCFLVQFSLAGVCEIRQGRQATAVPCGHVFVVNPGEDLTEKLPAGYMHFTLRVPYSALEEALTRQLGYRPAGRLRFASAAHPLTGQVAALGRLVDAVCEDLNSEEPGFLHPRVCASVEESLLNLLMTSLPHSHSEHLRGAPASPAPFYVRRVEEYIRRRATANITMEELIAASGVSARTLHNGFRRFRDTTPMAYLKAYRLDLARLELQSGSLRRQSVTDVALACGFTHLSKFARDFQQRFGEKPSLMLRRLDG